MDVTQEDTQDFPARQTHIEVGRSASDIHGMTFRIHLSPDDVFRMPPKLIQRVRMFDRPDSRPWARVLVMAAVLRWLEENPV